MDGDTGEQWGEDPGLATEPALPAIPYAGDLPATLVDGDPIIDDAHPVPLVPAALVLSGCR